MRIKKVERKPMTIHSRKQSKLHVMNSSFSNGQIGSISKSIIQEGMRGEAGNENAGDREVEEIYEAVNKSINMTGSSAYKTMDAARVKTYELLRNQAGNKVKSNVTRRASQRATENATKRTTEHITKKGTEYATRKSSEFIISKGAQYVVTTAAEIGTEAAAETAGAIAGGSVGPEGMAIGYVAGRRIGKKIGARVSDKMDRSMFKLTANLRKLKFINDKLKAKEEQKDSITSLISDLWTMKILNEAKLSHIKKKAVTAAIIFAMGFPVMVIGSFAGSMLSSPKIFRQVVIESGGSLSADYIDAWGVGGITEIVYVGDFTEDEVNELLSSLPECAQKDVCRYALSRVGYPYSQAERDSGYAYDCSSLVHWAWEVAGVDISYNGYTNATNEAKGLYEAGKEVSFAEIQPGDLIFWAWDVKPGEGFRGIDHVGIYVGNGCCVQAANPRKGVIYGEVTRIDNIVMVARPGN